MAIKHAIVNSPWCEKIVVSDARFLRRETVVGSHTICQGPLPADSNALLYLIADSAELMEECFRYTRQFGSARKVLLWYGPQTAELPSRLLDQNCEFWIMPNQSSAFEIVDRSRNERPAAGTGSSALIEMNDLTKQVSLGDRSVFLGSRRYSLFIYLYQRLGHIVSRDELLEFTWTKTYVSERTVDTHVVQLRRQISAVGLEIQTAYGIGYRMIRKEEATELPAES